MNRDILKSDKQCPESEKFWVFLTLMLVGGYFGAFTYSIRGGVFANAQTANCLLMAMNLARGNFGAASYYFIPIIAYLVGSAISEHFTVMEVILGKLRWPTVLVGFEIIAVAVLGFIPENASFHISQLIISFICAMQYNTFRTVENMPMATIFCTNHIRQTGVALYKWVTAGDIRSMRSFFIHTVMIAFFVVGAYISTHLCAMWLGRAIWVQEIPLCIVFAALLNYDIKNTRQEEK